MRVRNDEVLRLAGAPPTFSFTDPDENGLVTWRIRTPRIADGRLVPASPTALGRGPKSQEQIPRAGPVGVGAS